MNTTMSNPPEIRIQPVGMVSSPTKEPMLTAGESDLELKQRIEQIREHHRKVNETVSDLIIFDEWVELLDGIEDFSHVMVLYWPHLLDPARRRLKKVHPMGRKDMPLKGIFATRSPARPNPLLVSVVRLVERQPRLLKVKGLEAVDGSPILDIKPHVAAYDTREAIRVAPWMDRIQRELEEAAP